MGDLIDRIESGKNVAAFGRPPTDGEIGIVKISAVTWGEFNEHESKTLAPNAVFNPADVIAPGDFLISRANTLELVGAPVIVRTCRRRLVLSDKVLRLRFVMEGLDHWVELFLKSPAGRQQIEDYAQGAQLSMRNISQENLRRILVPIAPAGEMRRILACTDAVFGELDEAEAGLARARGALSDYRTSLLHSACTGALTATWRAANPRPAEDGPALLCRILAERRAAWERTELTRLAAKGKTTPEGDAWRAHYEEPQAPDVDNLPALPEGWAWASLSQLIGEPPRNGVSVQGRAEPPGTPALRLDALGDGELHHSRHRFIDIPEAKAAALFIAEGDFLVSRANGSLRLLGKGCVASRLPAPTVFPDTMIRFRFVRPSLGAWVSLAWRAGLVRRQFEARAKTSAGIWKVSQDDLLTVAIPMPPEREMEQAITTVEASMPPDQGWSGGAEIAALRRAVLHAAFTGRLAPQDPVEEPAAALLARLRAAPAAPGRAPRPVRPVQEALL